ncbi:uncharacterized protein LOC143100741 isoform X2 [Alosa pseudoharengus]
MKHLCVMFLLLCCTKVTKTVVPEVVAPFNPVLGVVGDDLILPCYLKNNVSAVDMEVQWIIHGVKMVHQYRRHMDITEKQLQAYRGRTSLFREELQRGNISLKLRSVRVSDTNTYKCYIKTVEGTDEASFEVQIHEFGNEPEIYTVSHNDGSVTLVCKSTNWTTKPSIEWMNGYGNILQHARDSEDCVVAGAVLHVQTSVTVQEKHGYNYTCRVSYLHHSKEKLIKVERSLFARLRHRWFLFFALSILVIPNVYYLKRMFQKHTGMLGYFKKQVLQDYDATLLAHGLRPDCYIEPQIMKTCEKDVGQIYKNISLEHIFNPYDSPNDPEPVPKVVILQGRSGYGKSFTAQRIVHDWASGAHYLNQFDLVLLLKSEDLNQQMRNSSVKKTLVELVCSHKRFRLIVKTTLMQSPHKVLFIIDGFDELMLSENGTHPTLCSPFSPASVEDQLLALLSGRILPESSLLVTTRPFALDKLRQLIQREPIKSTQIMDFSKDDVKQYFEKFFKSTKKNHCDLHSIVQAHQTLSASCCIPGMCSLVCTFLKPKDDTPDITELETVTSIFLELMISLVKQHYNKDALDATFLRDLAVLAEGGELMKKNRRSSKDLSDLKRNPFLCSEPPQMQCRFTYRVFQEFFMALGYIIPDGLGSVETLLTEIDLNRNTHQFAVIRFLYGLSNPKLSRHVVDQERMTSVHTSLKEWVCEEMKEKHPRYVRLFLLRCLYELHNEEVTKEAMQGMDTIELSSTFLNEVDCLVLQYCLQCCPNITCLDLRKCRLRAEELNLLTPALGNLQKLWLDVEDLADADVGHLISSLCGGKILREHRSVDCPPETSEPQVRIIMSAVKNLSPKTAAKLIDTFLKSKNNSFVSIEVAEEKNTDGQSSVSSISVNKDKDSFGVRVECTPQPSGSVPAVSLMNLTMTPSEDSTKDPLATSTDSDCSLVWLNIIECLSSQENVSTHLQQHLCTLCDLKKADIVVNDLNQKKAKEMFSHLFKNCPKLTNLRLDTHKEGGERICSSFDKLKNSRCCLQVTGYFTSEILLTLSERPEPLQVTDFLSKVHSLEIATEDLDNRVGALLSSVSDLRVVKDITLRVKCLTESWVNGAIRLMQKSPTLQDVKLMAIPKEQIDPQNICSSLSLKKLYSCLRVTAVCGSEISKVSLILLCRDAPISECTNIVQKIHSSGKETEINVELDNIVHRLLSLPGVEYVDLTVSRLTEIWANRILSTIKGRKEKIKVDINSAEDGVMDLCSSISVERDGDKFRLTANDWSIYPSYTDPALSHISLLYGQHSADWIHFLKKFHTLKTLRDRKPEVDDHINDLMKLLCSNGIKDVKLKVSNLTETWAERIIKLIQKCPSLENLSLSAGCNAAVDGLTRWVEYGHLEEDAINLLKVSRKMKCNITITGFSPYRTGSHREPVEIKI